MRRYVLTVVAGFALALLAVGAALAGGWATTEFDRPLPEFVAGDSQEIGFTILQNGVHPAVVDGAGLRFTSGDTGEIVFFAAEPRGAAGHYVTCVRTLAAGTWAMEVEQGLYFEPFPVGTVTVEAGASAAAISRRPQVELATAPVNAGPSPMLFMGLAAMASAAVGIGYAVRRRRGGDTATGRVEYVGRTEESAV